MASSASATRRGLTTMNIKPADVLKDPKWPEEAFFRATDFQRQDESTDTSFYSSPRFVTHIDDPAIKALTDYYAVAFPPNAEVLDICSSWISHYPEGAKRKRTVGMGMNEAELAKNKQLDEYVVKDLNVDPTLPFCDESFDVVTCVVSVDYLIKPLEVFAEISRVLKPGGLCIMSMSNRCFPTKAISIWLETGDAGHVFIVGAYFHYGSKDFEAPKCVDISPNPGRSDPMFIVQAAKKMEKAAA
ncbi:methyltransferase type 11 [Nannochloropsis oceanica]